MSKEQTGFWAQHYDDLATVAEPWLDYSNARVQAQTFALALEAAGPVEGRRCLDLGCGFGRLSAALAALGAASVCGVDQSGVMIARNRERCPDLDWIVGQMSDVPEASEFDLVLMVEVLQYVPLESTIGSAWKHVVPGGRLVAVVPNRECPIVQRPIGRFEGRFRPPDAHELATCALGLDDVAFWSIRGIGFGADQCKVPYVALPWTQSPAFVVPPNRLELVVARSLG